MKKRTIFALCILLWLPLLWAEVKNEDKPLRGRWDFAPQKKWAITQAGQDVLAEPNRVRISNEGRLYVWDPENRTNYIFNQDGTFIDSFGKVGQGPGEIRQQKDLFVIEDKVVVVDAALIHFFSHEGKFLEAKRNNSYRFRPVTFLSSDDFIACPFGIFEAPGGQGKVARVDLSSQTEKVITEFSIFEGGRATSGKLVGSFIMIGLTPQMTVGYGDQRIYYGMNDTYQINITDLDGRPLDSFSLDRKKQKVSDKDKRKSFERYSRISQRSLEQYIETTPNDCTFFSRIEVHDGLIYVNIPDILRRNTQRIDIFSLEGRYLYSGKIEIEPELTFTDSQLDNPVIKDGFLYAILQTPDLSVKIAKYAIKLPPNNDTSE
jgi:hypothetical protein